MTRKKKEMTHEGSRIFVFLKTNHATTKGETNYKGSLGLKKNIYGSIFPLIRQAGNTYNKTIFPLTTGDSFEREPGHR